MNKLTPIALSIAIACAPVYAIDQDKKLHFGASFGIGAISNVLITGKHDYWHSVALCLAVGTSKELYDEYDYGGFDLEDLGYDVGGCLLGSGYINFLESNNASLRFVPLPTATYLQFEYKFN